MHKTILTMALAAFSIPLSLVAQSGNVVLPQDKGPSTINVSSYPPAQQKAYKLFSSKCSTCHTIARPINTTMTLPEWERYVKRMMHKPNSGIVDSQGKEIYEFLAYDQVNRKDKNPSAFSKFLSDEEIEKLKAQQQ
uniref:Cytochrome c domain-containing protein n=1 Tax=mine drainage metagenome TaxID=410659 RepID=E6QM84_9ZZZZ